MQRELQDGFGKTWPKSGARLRDADFNGSDISLSMKAASLLKGFLFEAL
jgi:hypothetical protein